MRYIVFLLLLISSLGFGDEVGENPNSANSIGCENDLTLANHQFYLDLVFMRCIDECLTQAEKDPNHLVCEPTIDGSFKQFCLFNVWGFQMINAKKYYECIQKSNNFQLDSLKGKI